MRKSIVSFFGTLVALTVSLEAALVFPYGSTWKYVLGTQEASTPTTAWRDINFNDSTWLNAPFPIGYAAPANDPLGYEATIVTTVPTATAGNYTTVYLRKTFVVASPASFSQIRLDIVVDDGYVVWVNGTEVSRNNAPSGQIAFNGTASSSPEATVTAVTVNNASSLLVAGTNVVAVHLLNGALSSSDLFLDVSLSSESLAPTIASFAPLPGLLSSLNQISVTFSRAVTGVDAGDLLINGQPATALTSSGNTYIFSFVQPASGAVQISWSAAHGIQDLGTPPNPFDATATNATWQYDLQDRLAPVVTALIPTAGLTVRSLSQIEVHFSEPVRGVDAADLRVNGAAAAGLTVIDPASYLFAFFQPPTGAVQVAWNAAHGISDLASPSNSFVAGAAWSYVLNPNAPLPDVVIAEFLADGTSYRGTGTPPSTKARDEDGEYPDWIEIYNSGETAVNLDGWYLTDNANNLTKWQFPATNIAAKAYMIIFASEKNRDTPGRPLHTNFRLSNNGEFLALVRRDGQTLAPVFAPTYPPQIQDVSFGFPILPSPATLISTSNAITALVPTNGNLALSWTLQSFNDSTWLRGTNGVGFETPTNPAPSLRSFIRTDVQSQMLGQNASIFVRIPFAVADLTKLDALTLRLRYDDGFVAYVNGQEVARRNAPTNETEQPLLFNDRATARRLNTLSTNVEEFDLTFAVRRGALQTGTNVLAIHGLNWTPDEGDFLISAELISLDRDLRLTQTRYFSTPTPGTDNGAGVENLGPVISEEFSKPQVPQDNEDILVTALVTPTFSPVGQVTLNYRVMYGTETAVPMLDDGQHGDGAANDGVFGATIPAAGISTPGQMVRWYVRANDIQARTSRLPGFQDTNNSPEYFGTVVFLPETNNLRILHWFMRNPDAAATAAGQRGSLFYLGEFYDNIYANIHGQSSSGFPKHSYDIDFNPGNNFLFDPNEARVDDINLLTPYPDKAHMRNMLSYRIYKDAGSAYHWAIPVRVHTNGGFFGDWHMLENGDENFLKRLGKDPHGALYKMYNTFTDPVAHVLPNTSGNTGAEKKTRKQENNADLSALIAGVQSPSRLTYIFDNLNIPQMVNYLAARIMTGDVDCCHKNYYFYRDSDGTGEWEGFAWDIDLSFGRVWNGTDTYWNQVLNPNTGLDIGNNNGVFSLVLNGTPQTRQMYLRRIRTLMDEQLGSPTAPLTNFEVQVDSWLQMLAPDVALDAVKWPFSVTWGNIPTATVPGNTSGVGSFSTNVCCRQTIQEAANEIKASYLPQRRAFMYGLGVPAAQPSNAVIYVRSVEFSPTNGNQAQEYIELFNTNAYAVDISGWKISGGIDHTFQGGVVMPSGTALYLSPNVKAFRSRATGPSGGQSLLVQGNYKGQLSARGETIVLTDKTGRQVHSLAYAPAPSAAQQYLRITELMYHPSPLVGNTNDQESFEYIELKNIGPASINLSGIRFTNGITFSFSGSAVTNLAAGQTVLVVKSIAAFTARYGSGLRVAGEFAGNLDNGGERIELIDAVGEEILDFSYNNSWYPLTDGLGFSLVIVNEQAEPDAWDLKSQWRPSSGLLGSPGQNDPAPRTFAPVLVNEALTRTLTAVDAIELYNPNTNSVDVSGWFLTDDFFTPRKFRIPNGTVIPAGGFRVFDESHFNTPPSASASFALSSDGDEVYLFGAETNGNLTGFVHGFDFGVAEEGVSFGRHVTSIGQEHFVAQSALTLGAANSGPKVGPVVISEIMYHPPDIGTNDNSADEFIEVLNITTNTVSLFDPSSPTNTWRLSGGADFTFPTNVSLAPGEAALVLNIAPTNAAALATFRGTYSIGTNVKVFGPYSGKLNNDSDRINLNKPTPPTTNQTAPYALVDRVEYQDSAPWPKAADGLGLSLQRFNVRAYGNDPANWVAARPTTAAPTATNGTPPVITLQPRSQSLIAGQSGSLTVTASGTAPFTYQWRLSGTNVPGATNATLQFASIQAQQAGDYEAIVANSVATVFSDKATIIVRLPVAILQQPQTVDVRVPPDPAAAPTTNATFSVQAFSVSPIRFQWKRNGVNIPGATNDNFTIVGVQTNDFANFSVVVSDDISVVESSNVWLYPLISPNFVEPPLPQSVVVGGIVTLSALVNGWPPPYTFEWRLGAATLVTNVSDGPLSFFTFTAPTNVTTVSYRTIVRNRALPSGRASNFIPITTLADSDGDGIPDEWEIARGLNSTNASDRLSDTDGDGMLNWQEYQAGTDPTNALSNLRITPAWSNNVLRMQFEAVSNKTYALQYNNASLSPTNWQSLARFGGRSTNRSEVITDSLGVANRFYRLLTPAP